MRTDKQNISTSRLSRDYSPFGVILDKRDFGLSKVLCDSTQIEDTLILLEEGFGAWFSWSAMADGFIAYISDSMQVTNPNIAKKNIGASKTFTTSSGLHTVSFIIDTETFSKCVSVVIFPPSVTTRPVNVYVRDNFNNIVASGSYVGAGSHNLSFTPTSAGLTYKIEFYVTNASGFCYFKVDNVLISRPSTTTMTVCDTLHAGDYRYGFGNHEKIDEVSGSCNTVDMGDRWLDVRLGRTHKPDAKANKYPEISPYAYVLNNPIIFVDPDGKVVVDPKTGKQVVKVNGQWQTASGDAVSEEFVKNTQPVLDKLTASEVGTKIYEELQAIRTIVVIDLSDEINSNGLNAKGSNSEWRTEDDKMRTGDDGLYNKVIITPNLNKIENQAKTDNIDYEEKLIQVMAVEKGHIATKEQIDKEKKYKYKLFSSPKVVEDAYGPLLQDAVKAGKKYRDEKSQTIDSTSNLPIERVNAATGSNIPIPGN